MDAASVYGYSVSKAANSEGAICQALPPAEDGAPAEPGAAAAAAGVGRANRGRSSSLSSSMISIEVIVYRVELPAHAVDCICARQTMWI
jgi:hypothetical protein